MARIRLGGGGAGRTPELDLAKAAELIAPCGCHRHDDEAADARAAPDEARI